MKQYHGKELADKEQELKQYTGDDRLIYSTELKAQLEKQEEGVDYFRCGFHEFDTRTKGFKLGEIIVISGETGQGKTTFSRTLLWRLRQYETMSYYFTFEEAPLEFMRKFPELPKFCMPMKLKTNPNSLEETMNWLKERIWEGTIKADCKVVFIDHLHYLVPMTLRGSDSLMIGGIMREIKKIALDLNVIIFIIAHTRKVATEKTPEMTDIRDSQMVPCEADFVFMVWRITKEVEGIGKEKEYEYTDKSKIYLCKNRRTGLLHKLTADFKDGIFWEGL
jgi:replicative DNA helicase